MSFFIKKYKNFIDLLYCNIHANEILKSAFQKQHALPSTCPSISLGKNGIANSRLLYRRAWSHWIQLRWRNGNDVSGLMCRRALRWSHWIGLRWRESWKVYLRRGILVDAGPYKAAFTISSVNSLLLCATVTSLRAL